MPRLHCEAIKRAHTHRGVSNAQRARLHPAAISSARGRTVESAVRPGAEALGSRLCG